LNDRKVIQIAETCCSYHQTFTFSRKWTSRDNSGEMVRRLCSVRVTPSRRTLASSP